MIGQLRGRVLEKRPPHLLFETGGVGYELEAPLSTFFDLPKDELVLYTHLLVREDAHLLFGFRSSGERDLFRILIRVNGVGPKLALTLLSSAAEFVRCVRDGDATMLTRLPGVGKKTAERLIVELRDRITDTLGEQVSAEQGSVASRPPVADVPRRAVDEAKAALIGLGYKPAEATRAVDAVFEENLATEELIRRALKGVMG